VSLHKRHLQLAFAIDIFINIKPSHRKHLPFLGLGHEISILFRTFGVHKFGNKRLIFKDFGTKTNTLPLEIPRIFISQLHRFFLISQKSIYVLTLTQRATVMMQ